MTTTSLDSGDRRTVEGRDARAQMSVLLLTISAFLIVTNEFIIVGFLPRVAEDLGITIPVAGSLVTLFAFTVMLAGPILTALLAHLDRKRLFCILLVIFAASNALAAVATNFWILAFARFVPAMALPVFWGTASETAGQLAGPGKESRAVANVYYGISAAMVFGIPAGTLASTVIGWRGTFWVLAALSLVMALLLAAMMPRTAATVRVRLADQLVILKSLRFLANIALSIIAFTASFTAYTYLADLLQQAVNVPENQVGWWLMGFGFVGLVGNWLGGRMAESSPLKATLLTLLLLAAGMIGTSLLAASYLTVLIPLAIWGVANTALYPICQIRVMRTAEKAQALAGTMNVSMANAGIGIGAAIGGMVIGLWGVGSVGIVAGGLAIAASCLAAVMMVFDRR
jgi:DHA1 family inner membrane transport protein